ncbi:MAG: Si-specific NAD(P)(+) transhydrogenase [Deltaproteobacteria bacterium]|nr:Si-specific NAD(P)(+) transhydrogenase [Deltaproteobacteria bacterium]
MGLQKFDLVVIGSGPAGEKGAVQAAYFGKKVALIEKGPAVGGACVHTGTLPSKTLREAALYVTGFQKRELYGMSLEIDRDASLRQLMGRLKAVTELQVAQIGGNLDRHGVTTLKGHARFVNANEVVVEQNGLEIARLSSQAFLIAVGSSPHRPPGVPFSDSDVEDSDTILDLDRIPSSLAVVGGGVIGCEYACMFGALGTKITIIEGRDALMGFLDREISAALRTSIERGHHEILFGDAVSSIQRIPGGPLEITLGSGRILNVDKVLYSAGRAGNTSGLGLDAAGVACDPRGRIPVNEHFQTSQPHIYAAGDVVGAPALASVSMEQGRVGVCHAFGFDYKTKVSSIVPYGVYTIPEISMVGATEEELNKAGIRFVAGRARYEGNARGQIIGDRDGLLKLLFEVPSKKLLGVHIIGERATEMVHTAQMVMEFGGTIDVFINSVFNFPTLSEAFKYAAYDGLGRMSK